MVHLLPWPNSASFTVLQEMVPIAVPLPNKLFVGKSVSDFVSQGSKPATVGTKSDKSQTKG